MCTKQAYHRSDLLDQDLRLPRTKTANEPQKVLVVRIGHSAVDINASLVDRVDENTLQGEEQFLLWDLKGEG